MTTNNAWNSQDPAQVAKGGTGANSHTAYSVLCGGTTNTNPVQSIASVGTSGQVLTSNGAGALPTFAAIPASGGDWTLVASASASTSAEITFTDLVSTYQFYVVSITDLVPANNSVDLYLRTSTNNGASYDSGSSNYAYNRYYVRPSADTASASAGSTVLNMTPVVLGNAANQTSNWLVYMFNPSAATYTHFYWTGNAAQTGGGVTVYTTWGGGHRISAADVDAIQFTMSAGNIGGGEFRLYGISNA
jgi:hypothetical protein